MAFRTRVGGPDYSRDAASWTEISLNFAPDRVGRLHNIVKNAVADVLLKDPQIAIAEQVFL